MPDVGDPVTVTLTVSPFDGTTVVAAEATRPDGTALALAPATSGGGVWSATFTGDQPYLWLIEWTVTGTGYGVEYDKVFIEPAPSSTRLRPLASPAQLAKRLKVAPYTGAELDQVEELLADASAEMRSIIGQPLTRLTSTVTLWANRCGRVDLPAFPVVSVGSVTVDDDVLAVGEYQPRGRTLIADAIGVGSEVVVTFTHGWEPVPDEIVKYTCVLAAAMKAATEAAGGGALGITAGVAQKSEQIDDYRYSYGSPAVAGADPSDGLTLPRRIAERLRTDYGGGTISWLVVE